MSGQPPETESELVELLRSVDVRAPERLHSSVQALVAERSADGRGRRWRGLPGAPSWLGSRATAVAVGAAAAVALATAALLIVLGAGGSRSPTPTLREASLLTQRAATMAAPAESAHDASELAASVDGVAFPYWEERFGWRASGARVDELAGRSVTTVFYTSASGRRIGYAIVAGGAPRVRGGTIAWREGTPYRLLREDGARVVAWTREGHLCVVSGRGVAAATLLKLASWNERALSA